jgi:Uma2 family endonuclease
VEARNIDYITMTEDEFLNLGDTIKAEYCNGFITYMQASSPKHENIRFNIERKLKEFTDKNKCETYASNIELRVESKRRKRIVCPDVFIACDNNFNKQTYESTPLIIVEILSPSTAENDLGDKKDDYEYIGVKEYLVVSQTKDTIRQYKLIDGKYQLENEYHVGDQYKSVVFKDLYFDVSEVFKVVSNDVMPEFLE